MHIKNSLLLPVIEENFIQELTAIQVSKLKYVLKDIKSDNLKNILEHHNLTNKHAKNTHGKQTTSDIKCFIP